MECGLEKPFQESVQSGFESPMKAQAEGFDLAIS